ncbi:ACT domain-containing protein [Knoellia koreensis]|uniref:ACT domain-containing protein n=1 Tax=Knoellia koreensis TaxID=2730921 RepID=A0A849HDF2_9MICO|nr:ACT domain-containing protein [Knoellia sp. DB2414S]NNM44673.1 ACT domain-containing protein [Knoellia sp. DB2414S]
MSLPLHLMRHAEEVAFVRLPAGAEPDFDWRTGPLASVTYTDSETSVVCAYAAVPDGATVQGPLTAFEIAGPLDFATVGVLAGLLDPLAAQGISILAMSTYDTDWILVESDHADEAMAIWKRDGNTAAPARLSGGTS